MTLQLITVHADGTLQTYEPIAPILDYQQAMRLAARLRGKGIYTDVRIIATKPEEG